jgi:two-component system, sensor histidine kinase PdtaS
MPETERLFGYSRQELIGQSVDLLVPQRVRQRDRMAFIADPGVRAMGAGRELFALRKDGSEVPVELGLTP